MEFIINLRSIGNNILIETTCNITKTSTSFFIRDSKHQESDESALKAPFYCVSKLRHVTN